jgi:hypothetical protein
LLNHAMNKCGRVCVAPLIRYPSIICERDAPIAFTEQGAKQRRRRRRRRRRR